MATWSEAQSTERERGERGEKRRDSPAGQPCDLSIRAVKKSAKTRVMFNTRTKHFLRQNSGSFLEFPLSRVVRIIFFLRRNEYCDLKGLKEVDDTSCFQICSVITILSPLSHIKTVFFDLTPKSLSEILFCQQVSRISAL